MFSNERNKHLAALGDAYKAGDLTLYLGAGVSIANGLPPWDKLVLAMYFTAISQQSMGGWRPYPNYLFAIAEWHLNRAHEPLEITARRILKYQKGPKFLKSLRETLYAGFAIPQSAGFQPLNGQRLREANLTLDSVARLCEGSVVGESGVRAVITYNYDELLEKALGRFDFQSFCRVEAAKKKHLPIYHVHGFVPLKEEKGSEPQEIVFTEDQYNLAAHDPYSWANLVQIQSMSGSVGLMVGLSLSDRNMRRLLDAIVGLPSHPVQYAFLQRPRWNGPTDEDLVGIHEKAKEYLDRFVNSGVKRSGIKGEGWRDQIRSIIGKVEELDAGQQTFVLNQLGIKPIWYERYDEIPVMINQIIDA